MEEDKKSFLLAATGLLKEAQDGSWTESQAIRPPKEC